MEESNEEVIDGDVVKTETVESEVDGGTKEVIDGEVVTEQITVE